MESLYFYWEEDNWNFVNKKIVSQGIIKKHAEFYFIKSQNEINNQEDAFFFSIKDDYFSKKDLLNEYYVKFQFSYFGFNWDALIDCLRDLDWIEQKDIIIYHEKLPQLNNKDLQIYLEILIDTVGDWKHWEEHNFEVYFNMKDYVKIQQLISFVNARSFVEQGKTPKCIS